MTQSWRCCWNKCSGDVTCFPPVLKDNMLECMGRPLLEAVSGQQWMAAGIGCPLLCVITTQELSRTGVLMEFFHLFQLLPQSPIQPVQMNFKIQTFWNFGFKNPNPKSKVCSAFGFTDSKVCIRIHNCGEIDIKKTFCVPFCVLVIYRRLKKITLFYLRD